MTRGEAVKTIYRIINSDILDFELECELVEICNCICDDSFQECKADSDCSEYCEGCTFIKEDK